MRGIGGIMAALTATASEIIKAVSILNDSGRWIALQQCMALAENEMYRNKEKQPQAAAMGGENKETTWTGYFHGIKQEGNIIFPEWG